MKPATAILAAIAVAATVASAWATSSSNTDGALTDEVTQRIEATVAAEGYTLRSIEVEDGEIEVEATRDGELWELEIDPQSGEILKAELDD